LPVIRTGGKTAGATVRSSTVDRYILSGMAESQRLLWIVAALAVVAGAAAAQENFAAHLAMAARDLGSPSAARVTTRVCW
jgi:hypothetical protein